LRKLITGDPPLPPDYPLPSLKQLSEQYGVAMHTARRALEVLEREGLVYIKPYKGSFVKGPFIRPY
jgi:DNA-binding GntR family transcriptional regulator